MRVDWFGRGCVLGLTSPENNRTCGGIEASYVGVNDLGDSGAAMRVLRCSQPWEVEAGGPAGAGLVLAAGGRQD